VVPLAGLISNDKLLNNLLFYISESRNTVNNTVKIRIDS
jgi:hypothetical protein